MALKKKPLDFLDESEAAGEEGEPATPQRRLPPPPPPKTAEPQPVRRLTAPAMPRPGREDLASPMEAGAGAPLFIKLDRYKELLKEIQQLKSYALGLRDAMDALAGVEAELQEGIRIANKALDTFNTVLSLIDSTLMRNHGDTPAKVPEEMEHYIKNVHSQIEKIRAELKSVSV